MTHRINDSSSAYVHRTSAWLLGGFAAVALLLGLIGINRVIAYSVGQRTWEIGVRMAMGARPAAVHWLVLGEAGRLTAVGIPAGLACSVATASLMNNLLFGVSSWDVLPLALVGAGTGGLRACRKLPARPPRCCGKPGGGSAGGLAP